LHRSPGTEGNRFVVDVSQHPGSVGTVVARALTLVALVLVAGCGDEPADPLVQELREGGHVLVIRHATADAEISRQERLRSCLLQRNLTEAGREQARAIGEGVRELEIPIGDVRSSPMCRTRDTARLAFGRVTLDQDLVSPGVIGTEADDRRRAEAMRTMVEDLPPAGENTVLVTHTGNIGSALGEETVAEGETLVYGEGAELVGRVPAERWAELKG
jgi:phosphohistidine phosphatase SixA